jgi:hypothetical protein
MSAGSVRGLEVADRNMNGLWRWMVTYVDSTLTSPWAGTPTPVKHLQTVAHGPTSGVQSFQCYCTGEREQVVLPYGGCLRWGYTKLDFSEPAHHPRADGALPATGGQRFRRKRFTTSITIRLIPAANITCIVRSRMGLTRIESKIGGSPQIGGCSISMREDL